MPQGRVYDQQHQHADKQKAEQRDKQPRLDVVQLRRYAAEEMVQQLHDQPGGKARNDGPPEAAGDPAQLGGCCGAHLRQIAAHQAGHKAGPVCNAVGDERRQHRVHHGKGGLTHIGHQHDPF